LFSRLEIEDIFKVNGLQLPIIDLEEWCTPIIKQRNFCARSKEINEWIKKYNPTNYIIIDDISSGSSLCKLEDLNIINKNNIILVDEYIGFDFDNYLTMEKLLKSW
jgi:hypothetical protein